MSEVKAHGSVVSPFCLLLIYIRVLIQMTRRGVKSLKAYSYLVI